MAFLCMFSIERLEHIYDVENFLWKSAGSSSIFCTSEYGNNVLVIYVTQTL